MRFDPKIRRIIKSINWTTPIPETFVLLGLELMLSRSLSVSIQAYFQSRVQSFAHGPSPIVCKRKNASDAIIDPLSETSPVFHQRHQWARNWSPGGRLFFTRETTLSVFYCCGLWPSPPNCKKNRLHLSSDASWVLSQGHIVLLLKGEGTSISNIRH